MLVKTLLSCWERVELFRSTVLTVLGVTSGLALLLLNRPASLLVLWIHLTDRAIPSVPETSYFWYTLMKWYQSEMKTSLLQHSFPHNCSKAAILLTTFSRRFCMADGSSLFPGNLLTGPPILLWFSGLKGDVRKLTMVPKASHLLPPRAAFLLRV